MAKGKPTLPNLEPYRAAGINPDTGMLYAWEQGDYTGLKAGMRKKLRVLDEQNAVNRYTWYNLPSGLNGQMIERMLYYRGQLCFFYMEANDKYYCLPYALDGTIDVYGRFTGVTPLPFNGTSNDGGTEKKIKPWITGLRKIPLYEVAIEEDYDWDINKMKAAVNDSCVLLHDYTKQQSETILPRQQLQEPLIDVMSNCIPFLNTALLNSTGVMGMRVEVEADQSNVLAASASVNQAALTGQKFIPIVSTLEFQELTGGDAAKAEEFMMALQSLDNFRLSLYGLDNGGLFQKKSHMLEAEQEMNQGNVGLVMQDGLTIRQRFCDIVNSMWGLGIWCEVSENVIGVDRNGDMLIGDQQDQSGNAKGEQPQEVANDQQ